MNKHTTLAQVLYYCHTAEHPADYMTAHTTSKQSIPNKCPNHSHTNAQQLLWLSPEALHKHITGLEK